MNEVKKSKKKIETRNLETRSMNMYEYACNDVMKEKNKDKCTLFFKKKTKTA